MNPFTMLFDPRGRINRAKFWLAALIYLVLIFGVIGVTLMMVSSMTTVMTVALIVYIPVVISGIAVGIKRLHDRNKTGWWLVLFYAVPLLLSLFAMYALDEADVLHQVLTYLSFAINIWALIELGCLRGTIGGNDYGGDPLAPQPAPPRTLVR